MKEATTAAEQPQRDIPAPPRGGSWRFDEIRWEWAENGAAIEPFAAAAAAPTEAPAAEQLPTEE